MEKATLLPADRYVVINKSILSDTDRSIIINLYEPLIGSLAVSLYFTLWNDLGITNIISRDLIHHHLMVVLKSGISNIKVARESLEAFGLLKTYVKSGSINDYVYELYSPLSVSEFLNHPILNIVLYNNTGKNEYEKIVNYFKIPRINLSSFNDITVKFSDIFTSVPLTSYEVINDNVRKINKLKLDIDTNFDFNFLQRISS